MTAAVYMHGRSGRALDILNPTIEAVDFREIAETLAGINRYTAAFETPISVAQHTIIACAAAPDAYKPWVLLHDAHEQRVGDIGTPQAELLAAMAAEEFEAGDVIVRSAIRWAKLRHDQAIYAAAGLTMPGQRQRIEIDKADLVAMRTEIRDFNGGRACLEGWPHGLFDVAPLPRVFRFRPAPDVADELFMLMQRHLPALNGTHPSRR
ncbi:hypothetical protein [Terrihabitans sp. B22-R8]|uniref:hypothetical protein n=1 Tax=Terrihabitans sp. B22-R8 TaxID=3425128 RepID=UPI00403C916E